MIVKVEVGVRSKFVEMSEQEFRVYFWGNICRSGWRESWRIFGDKSWRRGQSYGCIRGWRNICEIEHSTSDW